MEMAAAAISAIGSAVSSGASAVGSFITGSAGAPMSLAPAAAGSSFGSTALSFLQGGLGLVGAMGALRAGQAQATAYRAQASDSLLSAGQVGIDDTNRDTSLRKALIKTIGERDTAYAASGIDLSFGTPAVARAQAVSDTANAISQNDQSANTMRSQYVARAGSYDAMADDAEDAGWLKAIGSVGTAGLGILQRG